jgi:eukaryotic-like serine/threonine-protein kinase
VRPMRAPNRHPLRLRGLRLHDRFAVGATASVHFGWLARELVCVKRMHPFHVVSEHAMKVEHPNVVATLGIVRHPGELLAALEYVPGASLEELRQASIGGLPPEIATAIVGDVLHGLHAAHETRRSIVPRGLSPSSILVGGDGRARLLDLDVHGPSTAAAAIEKLPYAAPEQIALEGGPLDVRRDVWAAGVILWEALTGRSLFGAPTVEETLHAIRRKDVRPPSHEVWSDIDPAVDAIVTRALSRDREERFSSAHEMAIALERTSRASADEVAGALAELDLRCISRRRDQADAVILRERSALHIECNGGGSKE